jgi:hypothetical protein
MSQRFVSRALLVASLSACAVEPLRSEQLYGGRLTEDASAASDGGAADTRETAVEAEAPPPDTSPDDAGADLALPDVAPDGDPDPACDYTNLNGSVSGWVVDACSGQPLDGTQVGVGGKHTCSFKGKGSFDVYMLPVGCDKTLTAARPGFKPYIATVHLKRDGNASVEIRLERMEPCDPQAPSPPAPACVCHDPACTQP